MGKLKFADLYKENKNAVEDSLRSLWCSNPQNDSQRAYASALDKIIPEVFAPNDAVPLVQCMNNYETVSDFNETRRLVGDLWKESYFPYKHQCESWKALLDDKKSIVVTTGTGSGKTECFMLPLVRDLIDNNGEHPVEQVQAIFLYPLNALMEDQKARLEKLLEGTNLKYAVYNGELPDDEPENDDWDYAIKRRKIDSIRGIERDDHDNIISEKYKHVIATRQELRQHPANILLTNPTMLEYILVRSLDQGLVDPNQSSLRWIAIDETHSYTGAGAAELAMLLRRVLMAYGVSTNDVRFATSSATISGKSATAIQDLTSFIAGITGVDNSRIQIIDGKRVGINQLPPGNIGVAWKKIVEENKGDNKDGYIPLDKIFAGLSIEKQLEQLDDICQYVENNNTYKDLKTKVHYFYRVPNQGVFVDISKIMNGAFELHLNNDINRAATDAPLLELSRCKHCGEYVAVAQADYTNGTYSAIESDDSDMFDLDVPEKTQKNYIVFGLSKDPITRGDNNAAFVIDGNKFLSPVGNVTLPSPWHVVGNVQCGCPFCGTKLTKQVAADSSSDNVETDSKKLSKFRVASDFIARKIAPSTLSLMKSWNQNGEPDKIHEGQQFISFVDSRQAAARSTIKQNLEQESLWIYSTIFHELCRRKCENPSLEEAIEMYTNAFNDASLPMQERLAYGMILQNLQSNVPSIATTALTNVHYKSYMTWNEISILLSKHPMSDVFCRQFADRSERSDEIDKKGVVKPDAKARYIQSVMVEYLAKKPIAAASPETMGLFASYYSKLEQTLTGNLPSEVLTFNALIRDPSKQIQKSDWKDFMQIFMDYTVRSNESIYLNLPSEKEIDIHKCVRFATQKPRRRAVHKPEIKMNQANMSRVVRLLANLIAEDRQIDLPAAIRTYSNEIQAVIDSMWTLLTDTYELLTTSTHYDEKTRNQVNDYDDIDGERIYPIRLNLADLSFSLYDEVYLCDTNVSADHKHVARLRPANTLFKGYSPYLIGGIPQEIPQECRAKWDPCQNYESAPERFDNVDALRDWAANNRALLWNNLLWGTNGLFSSRLEEIYMGPQLFVQAEHTAQVDKMIARQTQKDFLRHNLNILACSTTMEMGVDLGDLELVLLSSVPPHPSNYKQRAGRSGRRDQVRSACVTLCGSDALGLRALFDPMESVICKTVTSPTVDLNSAQVIQRHVNAFLVKDFGVFDMGDHGGSILQKNVDYYTTYRLAQQGESKFYELRDRADNDNVVGINKPLNSAGTAYERFNEICAQALTQERKDKLARLLQGTIFQGREEYVVNKAREANERCYSELKTRLEDLQDARNNSNSGHSNAKNAFFDLKFIEPLAQNLLSYWATHRFTPNANMPVDVIEFDVNSALHQQFSTSMTSNPSYPLRTALSQYAPGNSIARDGSVRIVRGLRYTNFFKPEVTFKKLYRNEDSVVIDSMNKLSNMRAWPVNGSPELELLQPSEFIPDTNEEANRILGQNTFTRVNAQLIGASEWKIDNNMVHLYSARSSREETNAQILYYNEGIGYGYCHCRKCGRTVLENHVASKDYDPEDLPVEMSPIENDDPQKPNYHYALTGNDRRSRCRSCFKPEKYIKRNAVLGDTVQTDYTEIRIRHTGKSWISRRGGNEENLLITLGVLFTQALADELNIERNDVDFTVTPNGHICVFDTNPGGSGYSIKLSEIHILRKIFCDIENIIAMAEKTQSKDALLDRSTLRYLSYIDIVAARNWIEEEKMVAQNLPACVEQAFPRINGTSIVTESSLAELESAFIQSQNGSKLFVLNDYMNWNYGDSDYGWRGHLLSHFAVKGNNTEFFILEDVKHMMNIPVKNMARDVRSWTKSVKTVANPYNGLIVPLAEIDGSLFFTANAEYASLNERWGNEVIYVVKSTIDTTQALDVDLNCSVDKTVNLKFKVDGQIVKSTMYAENLYEKSKQIIDPFISECRQIPDKLVIEYQDKYLLSAFGMIITLQIIKYMADKINKPYSLKFNLEEYENPKAWKTFLDSDYSNNTERDKKLEDLSKEFVKVMKSTKNLDGEFLGVVSHPKKELSHWRELSFKCGDAHLTVYPDGGFENGWSHEHAIEYQRNRTKTNRDNVSILKEVLMKLLNEIKIEITTAEDVI